MTDDEAYQQYLDDFAYQQYVKSFNGGSKPVESKPEEADKLLGYGRSFAEGASFGWGDELGLGLAALAAKLTADTDDDLSTIYDKMRSSYDKEQGQFREENPYGSFAMEMGAGLATGGGGLSAMKAAPTALGRGMQLAGSGAVTGGIAGSGFAGHGEKIEGGLKGAAIGGALAPVLPMVGNIVNRGRKSLQEHLPRLGGQNTIQRQVNNDLRAAGFNSADDVKRALNDLGPDATIADLSSGTRSRAEAIANMPGKGQDAAQAYVSRNAGSGRRMSQDVNNLFGGRASLSDFVDDIVDRSSKEAGPLYQKAFQQNVDLTPELARLLKMPKVKDAWKAAKELAEIDGIKLPEVYRAKPDGSLYLDNVPNMQAWDYIKKGLDVVIDRSGTTAMGKPDTMGRAVMSLKRKLLSELDNQVPDYASARKVYSGLAETKGAAESGAKFWNKTSHQIERELKGMSKSEQNAYRLGALQKIYDEARKTTFGGSVEKRIFNSPDKVDKIKAVLQDEDAYKAFEKAMRRESAYNQTYQATTQGSQTARRLAGASESGVDPSVIAPILGGIKPMAMSLLSRSKSLGNPSMGQRDELARLLMSPGANAQQAAEAVFAQNPILLQRMNALSNTAGITPGLLGGWTQR